MSQNINQIYTANPATSLQSTDLFYLGRSPYGVNSDFGVAFSTMLQAFPSGTWLDVVSGTKALASQTGYITDNGASLVTYTLPVTCTIGTIIEIAGKSAGGWSIAQNAGQEIFYGNQHTSIGVSGSLSSRLQYDYVKLLCITANTGFSVIASIGNLTVV